MHFTVRMVLSPLPRKHILSICSSYSGTSALRHFVIRTEYRHPFWHCLLYTSAPRVRRELYSTPTKKNIFWRCSNKKWENTGKMFTGCSDIVLHCEIHIRSFLIVQYLTVKLYHIYQYIIVYNMYIDIICFEFERLCCYWILLQCQWANLEDQDGGAVKVHPQDVLHLMCHL